jgi:isocitrate dehydrogenase kinase/phosphatase
MKHHADLLDADFWNGHKERILAGHVHDVFPYEAAKRFKNQRRLRDAQAAAKAAASVAPQDTTGSNTTAPSEAPAS